MFYYQFWTNKMQPTNQPTVPSSSAKHYC
uniref:Uncharacterized protein n=1 Tax=Rhizophora mucronata TaxID=61149 RepID=A0A2P2PZN0_RHIMU